MSGVVRLPREVTVLERGWLSSNNVVFSRGVTAVVDTGYVSHAPQTTALVRSVLGGSQLDLVICTHLHSDHCGGNAALKNAYPACRTLIPPGDSDAVARWDEARLTYAATGQQCARFAFDGLLEPGSTITLGEHEWEIHAAPGHDPHSVILFESSSRTLISADALWEDGFGVVFPELAGEPGFSDVANTLDLIESLDPICVIPGHGESFGADRVGMALAKARTRLAGQIAQPVRHARHAVKVLIKFALLDKQAMDSDELFAWAASTPYLQLVHARFESGAPFLDWVGSLLAELEGSRAIKCEGPMTYNV